MFQIPRKVKFTLRAIHEPLVNHATIRETRHVQWCDAEYSSHIAR
jgi:hypothetical protein